MAEASSGEVAVTILTAPDYTAYSDLPCRGFVRLRGKRAASETFFARQNYDYNDVNFAGARDEL